MRKNTGKKILAGMAGAAALLSQTAVTAEQTVSAEVKVRQNAMKTYDKVANVQGDFSFTQDRFTPPDEVFSLFETAATAACAKPGFAFSQETDEVYYINVKGCLKKSLTLTLSEIKARSAKEMTVTCSCATSASVANARITGVPVSEILEAAGLEEQANTITFRAADGYGLSMPLEYVLDKEAMIVYKIGGEELTAERGGQAQMWIPDTVAKYFTRQIVEIDVTAVEKAPELIQAADEYRAKVSVLNRFRDSFQVGDQIGFEGYADDFGVPIAAVEFSMDGGETWTTCKTEGASSRAWVYWHFDYLADAAGTYRLDVRAVTTEGRVSPMASSVVFEVKEAAES